MNPISIQLSQLVELEQLAQAGEHSIKKIKKKCILYIKSYHFLGIFGEIYWIPDGRGNF